MDVSSERPFSNSVLLPTDTFAVCYPLLELAMV